MSQAVRIGLVGCGRLAEHGYLPALRLTRSVELVAVADPAASRRSAVAASEGVAAHEDAASLLAGGGLDAVVLASPAAAHVADASQAVAADVPVLVEKPPAPDEAGAVQLAQLGERVWVGFNRRFDPAVRAVRDGLPSTGTLHLDLAIRYRRASWDAHTVRDDVLLDLGPHLFDLAAWITASRITSVRAPSVTTDHARIELTLERGTATIEVAEHRFHAEHVRVVDEGGAVVAEHRVGGPLAAVTGRVVGRFRPHPLVASLAAQLDAFAGAVRGRTMPDLGTPAHGVAVMAALDGARASAAAGGRSVPVTDPRETVPC